jgi:hypothetical protein
MPAREWAGNGFACSWLIFENRGRLLAEEEDRQPDGVIKGESVVPPSEGIREVRI